jgi:hypothetical protein
MIFKLACLLAGHSWEYSSDKTNRVCVTCDKVEIINP